MLPRSDRLTSPAAFRQAYEQGRTVGERLLVLHVLATPEAGNRCRVGFAVSRRIGNAVVRNRIRRRLREIFRNVLPGLPQGTDLVVAARTAAGRASYAELAAVARLALGRAGLLPAQAGPDGDAR